MAPDDTSAVDAGGDDLTQVKGVGAATAQKLREGGFETFEDLAAASPGEVDEKCDVGTSTAEDVIRAAREEADIGGFRSGTDIRAEREAIERITWGVPEVDDLCGGGAHTQSITEVYGEFGSGKSQVAHQLAVNVQLPPDHGGAGRGAVFIDTEDGFRPERISQMVRGLSDGRKEALMEYHGVEGAVGDEAAEAELVTRVLDNIYVAKAYNTNHQILMLEKVEELCQDHDVGLLVVDSLTAHFRAEYVGRGELAERQQKLNKHLTDIKNVCDRYNAAALVANQVASNPDSYFGDPTQPIGGNILGHASTYRIYLRKSKGDKRVVKMVDAPGLPDGEAVMEVTGDGLVPE